MANTYTQVYIQIVFAVKGRQSLIAEENRMELEKYICGIINNKESKPLAIYCNPDHLHVLVGLNPKFSISDLVRDIKANSSKWINEQGWINHKFNWQRGYGAFSYAKSELDGVVKYILNQAEHHRTTSFKREYIDLLEKAEVDYENTYLFDWITKEAFNSP